MGKPIMDGEGGRRVHDAVCMADKQRTLYSGRTSILYLRLFLNNNIIVLNHICPKCYYI